jgi:mono/diheme cytochrome c family protein
MKYGLTVIAVLALASCEAPGRRTAQGRVIRPTEVTDFDELYSRNCSACHGVKGQGALTVGIGSPVYLAITDDAAIRRTGRRSASTRTRIGDSELGRRSPAGSPSLVARS